MIEVILGALVAAFAYAVYEVYVTIKAKPQDEPLLKWLMKVYGLYLGIWNKDVRGSPFFHMLKSRKGVAAVNAVLTIIVVLFIAAIIMSQLGSQATTIAQNLNDTQSVEYISNVKSMGWNALYLFAISIIIIAAIFIVGIVNKMGGGSGGGP